MVVVVVVVEITVGAVEDVNCGTWLVLFSLIFVPSTPTSLILLVGGSGSDGDGTSSVVDDVR